MTSTNTSRSSSGAGGEGEPQQSRRPPEQRGFFSEMPLLIGIAFVLALLLKTFLVQAFFIPSASMEPTLLIGDRVLVNKVVYRLREPRRGEIVVFSDQDAFGATQEPANPLLRFVRSIGSGLGLAAPDEKDFIKRIMGLPGETIGVRDGVIHIDGKPLPETPTGEGGYLSSRDLSDFGPVTVPEGEYFMMGDNRANSSDSRFGLGTIPRQDIVGRAFVTIWPLTRLSTLGKVSYASSGAMVIPALLIPRRRRAA
ncbi:MAG: signal peptidase I [Actinomycetota bacterium]|nr:signal peptidase I [Actinomycetota bacterium]